MRFNSILCPQNYAGIGSKITHIMYPVEYIWIPPCKSVPSGICGQWRPRSACAFAQSDQALHCPLPESLECTNGEQRPGWDLAHAQNDVIRTFWACSKTLFRLARSILPYYVPSVLCVFSQTSLEISLFDFWYACVPFIISSLGFLWAKAM